MAAAADPKELVFVPGDHFFAGHLGEMRLTIESWLHERAGLKAERHIMPPHGPVARFLD